MNDEATRGETMTVLDFDPQFGLEYPASFNLEPLSIDRGPDLVLYDLVMDIFQADREGLITTHFDHALMLFHKLADDTAFGDLEPRALFAACMDTVLIWSYG